MIGDRLVEGADEVLALRQVDGRLAADRAVDLGDERRRDVDDRHPAQVDRGQEAGRVAERTAADRHDRLAPLDPQAARALAASLDETEALGRLALRETCRARGQTGRVEGRHDRLADGFPGAGLRDERAPGAAPSARELLARASRPAIPSPRTIRPIGVAASSRIDPSPVDAATDRIDRVDDRSDRGDPVDPAADGVEPLARGRERSGSRRSDRARPRAGAGSDCRRSRWASTSGAPSSQTTRRPR